MENMEDAKKIILIKRMVEMPLDTCIKIVSSIYNIDYSTLLLWSEQQDQYIKSICYKNSFENDPVVKAARILDVEKIEKLTVEKVEKIEEEVSIRQPLPDTLRVSVDPAKRVR